MEEVNNLQKPSFIQAIRYSEVRKIEKLNSSDLFILNFWLEMIIIMNLFLQVIAAMGGFAYFMDKDGAFRKSFSDGWDRILSKHPIPFYYCIGKFL